MRIYTGLIKDLGCRCFYYDSGMNIPIGSVCAEIPDIVSILMSRKGLPHFYEHIAIKREDTLAISYSLILMGIPIKDQLYSRDLHYLMSILMNVLSSLIIL